MITSQTGKQLNFNSCPLRGPWGFSPESTCQAPFPFSLSNLSLELWDAMLWFLRSLEIFMSLMSSERTWSHSSVIIMQLKNLWISTSISIYKHTYVSYQSKVFFFYKYFYSTKMQYMKSSRKDNYVALWCCSFELCSHQSILKNNVLRIGNWSTKSAYWNYFWRVTWHWIFT